MTNVQKKLTLSLANKLTLFVCSAVALSIFVVGGFYHNRTIKNTMKTAIENLAAETRLASSLFTASYSQMENDLRVLALTPVLEDVSDAASDFDLESLSGLSMEDRKNNLASVFTAFLAARPYYTQIRYIGLADNGREVVRVNRTPTGLDVVALDALQEKAAESYYLHVLQHRDDSVYYTPITDNREFEKSTIPRVATMRAVLPVFDEADDILGMLVINADYAKLLTQTFSNKPLSKSLFIVDQDGDYVEFKPGGILGNLETHEDYTVPPPAFISALLNTDANTQALVEGADISYFVKELLNKDRPNEFLAVVLSMPKAELLVDINKTRWQTLLLIGGLLLIFLIFAVFISRKLTQPLTKLTKEVANSKDKSKPLSLPITASDETGDLARKFQGLMAELDESEARLRAVINTIVDGIITMNEAGVIDSYNPACERIFGYTESEVLGKNVSMLMPEPHRGSHDQYLKAYATSGERKIDWVGREEIGQHKDGTNFPLELSVNELMFEGRRVLVGTLRDITERKMVEKTKSEFISTVSHELRTPLTSIKGALGLINGGALGALPDKFRPMLNIAYDNSNRLVRLINDILDVEKLESGAIGIVTRPLDLATLITDAIAANAAYAATHDVTFVPLGTDVPAIVSGDEDRLMQVMANLMSNAAKFSPQGGKVHISLTRVGDNIRITVKDNGSGIPENARDTVFERFTQADSSDQRQKGGTGLGLAITKTIVERHDGTVAFTTEIGKGTTFYVDLPELLIGGTISLPDALVEGQISHLLICEDDPDVAMLLKIMLETAGYRTSVAGTALEAKQLLKHEKFDGMTLDIALPGENGIDLLKELRSDPKTQDLPIVIISAYVNKGKQELNGGAVGSVEWIDKPINAPLLMARLGRALGHVPNATPRILHVEDDQSIRHIVASILGDSTSIVAAKTLKEARTLLAREKFDLIVLDLELPDGHGQSLLPLFNVPPQASPPVVIFAASDVTDETVGKVEAVLVKSQASNAEILKIIQSVLGKKSQVANERADGEA